MKHLKYRCVTFSVIICSYNTLNHKSHHNVTCNVNTNFFTLQEMPLTSSSEPLQNYSRIKLHEHRMINRCAFKLHIFEALI